MTLSSRFQLLNESPNTRGLQNKGSSLANSLPPPLHLHLHLQLKLKLKLVTLLALGAHTEKAAEEREKESKNGRRKPKVRKRMIVGDPTWSWSTTSRMQSQALLERCHLGGSKSISVLVVPPKIS
jgi:hypothetical protein